MGSPAGVTAALRGRQGSLPRANQAAKAGEGGTRKFAQLEVLVTTIGTMMALTNNRDPLPCAGHHLKCFVCTNSLNSQQPKTVLFYDYGYPHLTDEKNEVERK